MILLAKKSVSFTGAIQKIAEWYRRYDNHDFSIRRDIFSHGRALGYIVFFAFVVRLVIAVSYVSSYDTEWNIRWGVQLGEGFFSAHAHVKALDYPPLYLYPLYIVGRLIETPEIGGYPPFRMLAIKFLPCLCDSLTCVVFYALARRRNQNMGLFAATLWAVNPATIFNCACWGQTDCVLMLLAALLMLSLEKKHVVAAGVLWAVMCSTKLQGLYLTPVVGMETLTVCFGSLHPKEFSIKRAVRDKRAVMRFVRFVCAAAVTLALVYLPFMFGAGCSDYQPELGFWQKFFKPVTVYSEGLAKYPYCSLNADNIYMLFGLNGVKDQQTLFAGISIAALGKIFLLLSVAGVVAIYIFGRQRSHWLAGFVFMECVFMLTCRQHERYQIIVLPLLMGALIQLADRRLLTFFGLHTMVIFFNQFRVLSGVREKTNWWRYYKYAGNAQAAWLDRRSGYASLNAWVNLLLFITALLFAARFFLRKRDKLESGECEMIYQPKFTGGKPI